MTLILPQTKLGAIPSKDAGVVATLAEVKFEASVAIYFIVA